MSRMTRKWIPVVLCLVVVAGLVLTGCGKMEAALQQPGLEYTQYIKGSTVDLDETTINTMADSGGEGGFKYNVMQAMYPTIFNANKDTVAQDPKVIPTQPYWRGDGVHTYY